MGMEWALNFLNLYFPVGVCLTCDVEFIILFLFQVIGECYSAQIDDQVVAKYKSLGGSHDREIFLDFGLQTLLYQPTSQRLDELTFCIAKL